MSKSKKILHLLAFSGAAMLLWALASRAITSETVTLRLSATGFEFKAEGFMP